MHKHVKNDGDETTWNGFRRLDFEVDGHPTLVVFPDSPLKKNPWIWRARFFDSFPFVDRALVARGFHLVYTDLVDLYGSPVAMARMDRAYAEVTQRFHLNARPVLEGFSRGGLAVYHWAANHPDRVACIYADAPVCDIRSWPGGLGAGVGSPENWRKCLAVYGLTETEAANFENNPIDRLEPLAAVGIPILHVCGDADKGVPMAENTDVLVRRYRALGGHAVVLVKPGCGHHPHSLDPPDAIVEILLTWLNLRIAVLCGDPYADTCSLS